jgi:FtsH-binding integral membrane protein
MAKLRLPECGTAAARVDKNAFYDAIELYRIDAARLEVRHNPYMYNLTYVLMACTCLEFIVYFWHTCGKRNGKTTEVLLTGVTVDTATMIFGHWAHIVAGVSISLFAASAALSNEVAACSPYNGDNATMRAFFISLLVFYGVGSVNVLTNLSNTRFAQLLHAAVFTVNEVGGTIAKSGRKIKDSIL